MLQTTKTGGYLHIAAPAEWNGLTIEQILKDVWKLPKKMVHQFRMDKSIHLNGEPVSFSAKIATNDKVSVNIFTETEYGYVPVPMEFQVLYEDDHLIVVNKPAGISTHPNQPADTNTLSNAIAHYLQSKGEIAKIQHIHRLDKDTSGAILFAKHSFAGVLLDHMLSERKIKRTYTALVHGSLKKQKGTVHAKIGRDRHHPTRRRVSPSGQDAVTHYQVIRYIKEKNISQILCRLDTGRTHQIRVHMSYIGHPLIGDVLYGGKPIVKRQALHAKYLNFIHPITQEEISVEAPYNDDPPIFEQ